MDNIQLCRCCQRTSQQLIPMNQNIVLPKHRQETLTNSTNSLSPSKNIIMIQNMFNIFSNIQFAQSTQKQICPECLYQLQNAYEFNIKCIMSEKQFLEAQTTLNDVDLAEKNDLPPLNAEPLIKPKTNNVPLPAIVKYTLNLPKNCCSFCKKEFRTQRGLMSHLNKAHNRNKIEKQSSEYDASTASSSHFSCITCKRQFTTATSLVLHNNSVHSNTICSNCNFGYNNLEQLTSHIRDHHSHSHYLNKFVCNICSNSFMRRTALLRHYQCVHKHKGCVFFCGLCKSVAAMNSTADKYSPSIFKTKADLLKHINEDHKIMSEQQSEQSPSDISLIDDLDMPVEFLNYNLLSDDCLIDDANITTTITTPPPTSAQIETGNTIEMVEEFLDDAFQMPPSNVFNEYTDKCDFSLMLMNTEDDGNLISPEDGKAPIEETISATSSSSKDIELFIYKCPQCSETFQHQLNLNIHLAHVHHEMVLMCNQCGASFNQLETLEWHRREHVQENRFAKESLSQFFGPQIKNGDSNKTISYKIVTDSKTGMPIYFCEICGKKYSRKFYMEQHFCRNRRDIVINSVNSINENEPQKCRICRRKYLSLAHLKIHEKTHKSLISMNLCCSLCDKSFCTIGGLKYHLKTHTGVKAFRCPYCGRKFVANINLHSHIRQVHAEKKPYKCLVCLKTFGSMDHLKKHQRFIHQGERNFECQHCGKLFRQQSHLTHHSWIHSNIKAHPCQFCTVAYTTKSSLKKHMLKIHKNN